jgi:hypothetical protein
MKVCSYPCRLVVLVSKANMLSARTTSLASYIPTRMLFSSDSSSGLLLTLVLLHEMILGEKSQWWGYLQSLPKVDGLWGVYLPSMIAKKSQEWTWLEQTEVGRMVKRADADPEGRIEGLGLSFVSRSFC